MPNFVKDQFPSESLSSFQTSVTTAATAGPANTTAATLSNLAQSMENTPVGASVNVSHSVPNPLGNITSFAATIQQINEKLQQDPNNGKRYLEALANDDPIRAAKYNEWLGLCALVALRNVYSSQRSSSKQDPRFYAPSALTGLPQTKRFAAVT